GGMEPSLGEGVLLFLALAPAIWLLILRLAAQLSGWTRMSPRFGSPGPFAAVGEPVRFASAQIGWGNYNGVLHVRVSPSGLYLAPILLFRPFHPPLFLPWGELVVLPGRRGAPELTLRSLPGVRIRFSGRAGALVGRYLPG
ncbi:MAG: hypothetical protein N2507_06620, partial [Candidatus Bipolaricaulota bacterium]|nr:hypothetical protein [Candidatus Bipolaricaulota bacterium]